jgi:hypothetical protein
MRGKRKSDISRLDPFITLKRLDIIFNFVKL